jgi:NADH-quinone oxidoreductase subunit E
MSCASHCCGNCSPQSRFDRVVAILDRHERNPARLITILQEVQHEYRYLPEDVLTYLAIALAVPPAQVFGVATFYAHFTLRPKGEHVVRLCDGTACHVKGSQKILDALRAHLGLKPGETTTPDMKVTVETVSCLGACGLAPVMTIDETVHGQLDPAAAVALLDAVLNPAGTEAVA